jgi:hypothetical protein
MKCLISISDPLVADKALAQVRALCEAEVCSHVELTGRIRDCDILLADAAALSKLHGSPSAQVIGLATGSINDQVELLVRQPWLQQLVTTAVFDGDGIARILYGIVRQANGVVPDTMAFLGMRRIHARRVLFYRSSDVPKRLEKLEQFAQQAGARSRAVEQLHDIANELLANAFYDAPYEARLVQTPPERAQAIQLPPDLPCEVIYGELDDELFVRVRDCFGALTRARLLEVLGRCAGTMGAVPLDESRGGAGLGMWRIFSKSSRVVVSVVPEIATEMLVTVPKSGLARNAVRAWHLLFAPPQLHAERHP